MRVKRPKTHESSLASLVMVRVCLILCKRSIALGYYAQVLRGLAAVFIVLSGIRGQGGHVVAVCRERASAIDYALKAMQAVSGFGWETLATDGHEIERWALGLHFVAIEQWRIMYGGD